MIEVKETGASHRGSNHRRNLTKEEGKTPEAGKEAEVEAEESDDKAYGCQKRGIALENTKHFYAYEAYEQCPIRCEWNDNWRQLEMRHL